MIIKYENARDILDTLDILLFSNKGPISTIVKLATRSTWSHVAAVLKIRGSLYCWESTTLNESETVSGVVKKGVQLTPLYKRIADYSGEVAFRTININRDKDFLVKLDAFKKKVDNLKYEENYWELFKATFDVGRGWRNRENLETIFCSELVAEALQVTDIISDYPASNEYTPANFADKISFAPGYHFNDSKPIYIEA